MIIVDKKLLTDKNGKKYKIYPEDVDISRVPRIFLSSHANGSVFYRFPRNDIEQLQWLGQPRSFRGPLVQRHFGRPDESASKRREIYHVVMEAKRVTVEDCLELLKGIGCESRFIACSVEKADLFFAELNKDDATRLKDSNGVLGVYRHGRFMIQL